MKKHLLLTLALSLGIGNTLHALTNDDAYTIASNDTFLHFYRHFTALKEYFKDNHVSVDNREQLFRLAQCIQEVQNDIREDASTLGAVAQQHIAMVLGLGLSAAVTFFGSKFLGRITKVAHWKYAMIIHLSQALLLIKLLGMAHNTIGKKVKKLKRECVDALMKKDSTRYKKIISSLQTASRKKESIELGIGLPLIVNICAAPAIAAS